jgi:hypothetical protein
MVWKSLHLLDLVQRLTIVGGHRKIVVGNQGLDPVCIQCMEGFVEDRDRVLDLPGNLPVVGNVGPEQQTGRQDRQHSQIHVQVPPQETGLLPTSIAVSSGAARRMALPRPVARPFPLTRRSSGKPHRGRAGLPG